MKTCTQCGALNWDASDCCSVCSHDGLREADDPNLRSALLLACHERPGVLSDSGVLISVLRDICPPVAADKMLMAALEHSLSQVDVRGSFPLNSSVKAALSGGRHPYPESVVAEVTDALEAVRRYIVGSYGFVADPRSPKVVSRDDCGMRCSLQPVPYPMSQPKPDPVPDSEPKSDSNPKPKSRNRRIVAVASLCCLLVLALVITAVWVFLLPSSQNGKEVENAVSNVFVRPGISGYSWDELKLLADAIAEAQSDDEGLAIAKAYNLTDGDGGLQGDTKCFILNDGTETSVRILGFRHDERTDGGLAGITFEFADVPMIHNMNTDSTNVGGWEASAIRTWLNDDFLTMMPVDLRSHVVPVVKTTNNAGEVEYVDDTSVVSPTTDKLWLLSMTEVYGTLSELVKNVSAIYDAEGTQYQLYADQGVSTTSYDYCTKSGLDSWWWLRSPFGGASSLFHCVHESGAFSSMFSSANVGVSPAFCF